MKIGDIYWIKSDEKIPHPYVIIEIDDANNSVLVCALTTNMKKLNMPGNVVLNIGEGNLVKQSIVEVYKRVTIRQDKLKECIGSLSESRIQQIKEGIGFIKKTYFKNE